MYPSPIRNAIPSFGWIAFLSFDSKTSLSTLYKGRLHSPVDNIKTIGRNLTARVIHCSDGIIFLSLETGPIKVIQFAEGAIDILSKAKRKGDLIKVARQLKLSTAGIIQELKDRLQRYHTSLKANYEQKNILPDEIHFWNAQTQPLNLCCAMTKMSFMLQEMTPK